MQVHSSKTLSRMHSPCLVGEWCIFSSNQLTFHLSLHINMYIPMQCFTSLPKGLFSDVLELDTITAGCRKYPKVKSAQMIMQISALTGINCRWAGKSVNDNAKLQCWELAVVQTYNSV